MGVARLISYIVLGRECVVLLDVWLKLTADRSRESASMSAKLFWQVGNILRTNKFTIEV